MRWSKGLAYVIGLITTDGNLSSDKRHLAFVSKDIEQIILFAKILKLKNKISPHQSSYNPSGKYFHIQFSNVGLYRFLTDLGLSPNKSHTIGELKIPPKYFTDFLRGHLDGDGNISIVKHPESCHPQLRLRFCSASIKHLRWLKIRIAHMYDINGGFISKSVQNAQYLTYSTADAKRLLEFIYYDGVKYFLYRKHDYYLFKMGEWRNRYTRTA